MKRQLTYAMVLLFLSCAGVCTGQSNDLLIADFEQETYGDWTVQGTAFGPGPALGTLPGQMDVSGYEGKRLVNSFFQGDDSVGQLTSPQFKVERKYINFLIGGGMHPETAAIQLLVDEKVVRSATGPNDRSGGSERLDWHSWDVSNWMGQQASIRILDQQKGGWGHLNVDQIYQSDQQAQSRFVDTQRELELTEPMLLIPISNQVTPQKMVVQVDGETVHQFEANLAVGEPDWWAYLDVSEHLGKTAELKIWKMASESEGLNRIRTGSELPSAVPVYQESLRPQLRFSQKRGWNNDPNGMVYLNGQYHFFWQSNPVGWTWNNMYWGHAVSKDLVHWQELPHALSPHLDAKGLCFSGGAIVDAANSSGWQVGSQPPMVLAFTDTGSGEALMISRDSGQTFQPWEHNPVVKHQGRDPKIVWYSYSDGQPPWNATAKKMGGHWVMAVYDEDPQVGQNISFYVSTDLKAWDRTSQLPGFYECPEMFQLPVKDSDQKRWVLFAADAQYVVGEFDGKQFVREHEGKHRLHYGDFYASQCFTNVPGGRVIQVGWARVDMPGMPFNQAFSLPIELTLEKAESGIRMLANPVQEWNQLQGPVRDVSQQTIDGEGWSLRLDSPLVDLHMQLDLGEAQEVEIQFGENRLVVDRQQAKLGEIPLGLEQQKVNLRIIVDRPMYEMVVDGGKAYATRRRVDAGKPLTHLKLRSVGGNATLTELKVFPLKSIW